MGRISLYRLAANAAIDEDAAHGAAQPAMTGIFVETRMPCLGNCDFGSCDRKLEIAYS